MKNIFIYLLVLSLLGACSGNQGNKGGQSSGSKAARGVIKALALISREDASALLGQSMDDNESDKRPFIDESKYVSKDYNFSIAVWQEALHDKSSEFEKKLLKNGWAGYMKEMEKAYSLNYHQQNIVETGGIPGSSYLQEGGAMGLWLLHLFYGDYYITITVSNTSFSKTDSEKETAWKQAKLKEAGQLAVRKLKDILG